MDTNEILAPFDQFIGTVVGAGRCPPFDFVDEMIVDWKTLRSSLIPTDRMIYLGEGVFWHFRFNAKLRFFMWGNILYDKSPDNIFWYFFREP